MMKNRFQEDCKVSKVFIKRTN